MSAARAATDFCPSSITSTRNGRRTSNLTSPQRRRKPVTANERIGVTVAAEAMVAHGTAVGDGILNVNKPAGLTSHDVVAKVRGLLKGQKVGHAGTLDPAATGVLPILVSRGTRIAEY